MILTDTSVWIDLLNGPSGRTLSRDVLHRIVTCGPVVQEVMQGIRYSSEERAFRAAFDAIPRLSDPLPERVFSAAADIFRQGRRQGYTIRSSMDCLIAAIALEHGVPVWHKDRDFPFIAKFTALEAIAFKP